MRKFTAFLAAIALSGGFSASAGYVTRGDNSVYTFETLSKIDGSGVTKNGDAYEIADDLEIAATDTLRISDNDIVKLGNQVQIKVCGYGDLAAPTTATITRIADTDEPKGFYIYDTESAGVFRNLKVEYCGIRTSGTVKGITVDKCSFSHNNGKLSSAGAIAFGSQNAENLITDCSFISSVSAAIGGAANLAAGVTVRNCLFIDCNTGNSNRPVINVTVGGDNPIVIEGNTVLGNKNTKVGGIGVSNLTSISGSNKVTLKNNTVLDCRYGLTTTGPMDVVIDGNTLIDNHYETNAMIGGSGMSLYDPTGKQTARVTGNYIEGSLWGITVIGCADVNLGKTADVNADDYNPGLNTFINNGNGGIIYDLYNNSANTIYAQGNMWNVNEQTPEEIAKVITDKSDISSLGEVIFDPATAGTVRTEPHTLTATANFDKVTLSWQSPKAPIELKWHDGNDYNGYDGIQKDPEGAIEMIMAARFTASDLAPYTNKVVEAIDYFEYRDFVEAYAQIYENGKLVRNQKIDLSNFTKNSWRSTTLDEPYIISGNDEIIIGVKYKSGYNQTFTAITDRYATPGKGNIVSHDDGATWSAEGPGDFMITAHIRNITTDEPKGYAIIRDDDLLTADLITETSYTITGNADGEHEYTVQAVYDGDFVRASSIAAKTVAVTSLIPAPATIAGSVEEGLNGSISWQAPLKRNDTELTWSNKEYGNSIGGTASAPKLWVKQEFDANDLIAYPGFQIKAINAYFAGTAPTAVTLFVMKDGKIDFSQAIPAEEVAAITVDGWTKFSFETPYELATGYKYAYGFYCTHAKSAKPIGVDKATAIDGKGNAFSTSSASSTFGKSNPSWKTLASGGIAGNFLLTADVEALGETPAAEEITGYDVYADGELAASDVTSTTFSETVDRLGAKTYSVVAKSASGKVSPAKEITLNYTLPDSYTAPLLTGSNFDESTGKVDIAWSNDAVTLKHCGDPKYLVSLEEDVNLVYGAKFSAEELAELKGYEINSLQFAFGAQLETMKAEIYAGKELLRSYDISKLEPNVFYTLTVDPVAIPENTDIYIAYNAAIPAGTSAIIIDGGPGVEGGAVASYNGGANWLSMSSIDPDFANYNIVVGAMAQPIATRIAANGAAQAALGSTEIARLGNMRTIDARFSEYGIEAGSIMKAPAAKKAAIRKADVKGFRVYRNEEVVAETTANSFSEVLSRHGEYNYYVTNVYANGWESPASKVFNVRNVIEQKPEAPYGLKGEAEGSTLSLSWDAIDATAAVFKLHNGNYSQMVGMTSSSNEGYQAMLLTADNIATMNKAGEMVTHIKFHISSTELSFASVFVMFGNNVVNEQSIDIDKLLVGWNVVRLNNPVVIPAGVDVKIGYHCKYAKGIKPLSTDDGPAIAGYGDLISASTFNWYSLAKKYSLNYNFLIEGVFKKADQVIDNSAALAPAFAEGADVPAITYNVYRDGLKIAADVAEKSFTVANAEDGVYTVTAVVDGAESAESNAVSYKGSGSGINAAFAADATRYDRNADAVLLPAATDAKVYSANGTLVKTVPTTARVDMSDLPAGAYIVRAAGAVIKVVK